MPCTTLTRPLATGQVATADPVGDVANGRPTALSTCSPPVHTLASQMTVCNFRSLRAFDHFHLTLPPNSCSSAKGESRRAHGANGPKTGNACNSGSLCEGVSLSRWLTYPLANRRQANHSPTDEQSCACAAALGCLANASATLASCSSIPATALLATRPPVCRC